jgi:hypothetical protein
MADSIDVLVQLMSHDDGNAIALVLRDNMRSPEVAANLLVEIITGSTRDKDGGEFHSIDRGRHPG